MKNEHDIRDQHDKMHQKLYFSSQNISIKIFTLLPLRLLLGKFWPVPPPPPTGEIFMGNILWWKISFLVHFCMLTPNMIFIFHKKQLLIIEILKNCPFCGIFCCMNSIFSEVWTTLIKINIFFQLFYYYSIDCIEVHWW